MTPNKILAEELRRQAVWMIPLCLLLLGLLILVGRDPLQVAASTAVGYAYTLFNFYSIGRSSAYASLQRDSARATKIILNGFIQRYLLTTVYLVFSFLSGVVDIIASVTPLLFPKAILLIFHAQTRRRREMCERTSDII